MRYIYCHPLFDERKCAHRFSYQLSETLRKKGLELERFDYQGTGEAQGHFYTLTTESMQNDLKKKVSGSQVCLIGTRFGATVAFNFCCRKISRVINLILIEPVISGKSYVNYLFRKQRLKDIMTGNAGELLPEDGFFNLEGYKTSNKFIEQIRKLSLSEKSGGFNIKKYVRIAQISVSSRIDTEFALFADTLQKNSVKVSLEIFNLPSFWERIPDTDYSVLTERIVEWCSD
jgi:hypothetical protein